MTEQTPRPRLVKAVGSPKKEATRGFTKRVTVASLALMFGLAGYGLYTANPDTAGIVTALGPWVVALLATYMAVGYGDHRISKGLPSLTDILGLAFARRGGGGHRGYGDPEGPLE